MAKGWKLRKDKLRAETADAPQSPADGAPDTEPAVPAAAEPMPLAEASLNPLPHEADNAPAFDAPFDWSEQGSSPKDAVLHLDMPEQAAPPHGAQGDLDDSPAFDPLSFAPSSDLDSAPAFATRDLDSAPAFATSDLDDAPVFATNDLDTAGADDAPVFGVESVFAPEDDEDAPLFAPMSSAFDPLPDASAEAIALPPADAEPIVLGGDLGGTLGAFAPYQPQTEAPDAEAAVIDPADDAAYSDPELEVGASAFDPQSGSFGAFNPDAPTAGEEIVQELPAPAFADPADTSPLAFEPAFEAPDALAGEALPPGGDDGDEPFMDREALAAGLVTMASSSGLPRVAPFVLAGPEDPAFGDDQNGPHSLILRLGSLSATYPLAKPVTTIGRPDRETATYPDIEVELDDGVSRRHAEVRQEGDTVYVVDLGSTNGTILNGELLTPNQPARLMRGDRIRIGERVEIVFE